MIRLRAIPTAGVGHKRGMVPGYPGIRAGDDCTLALKAQIPQLRGMDISQAGLNAVYRRGLQDVGGGCFQRHPESTVAFDI